MNSEFKLYLQTSIFAAVIFGLFYFYISWMGIPSVTNKAMADTSIFLMGWSMLLSSVCYFWNVLDKMIVYRKYLGLVGFAFAIAHLVLSWSAFLNLLSAETWQAGKMWAPFTGTLAFLIFTVMALISNTLMAKKLGGRTWKLILRTGYVAVIFVAIHVVVLKSARWITWMQEGFPTPPSLSFMISIFMLIVLVMRVALWIALKMKKPLTSSTPLKTAAQAPSTPSMTSSTPVSPSQVAPPTTTPSHEEIKSPN